MKKALVGLRQINLEGLRWRVIDAKGQILGRLASQISTVLQESEHPFVDRPLEHFEMPPRKVREMRPRTTRALVRANESHCPIVASKKYLTENNLAEESELKGIEKKIDGIIEKQ
ncbi:uncharacterized protein [Aristolochia californica]|uniref:uncharacterized protein n=1 Tax=Aristolochia californica TaxID=171875 RepID=UPI0035D747AD